MIHCKGILFDNDGTLVDTRDLLLASFRHCTTQVLGRTYPDDVLLHGVGTPLAVQMQDLTDDPETQQELLRVYREYNHAIHDEMIRAFPDVPDGLAALRERGYSLGVVTAKMRWLAWHGLEITNLAPYFSCCIGADDCELHKPHPDPILMGCERLGLAPTECLYVGDSPYDIQAGNAAGCRTAAVLWGMFDEKELRNQAPTFVCSDFKELIEAVDSVSD